MPKSENREALDRFFRRIQLEAGQSFADFVRRVSVEELGGLRVTVPDEADLHREERDRQIRAAFNGHNYEELSLRFSGRDGCHLSVRQIRYIIDGGRKKSQQDSGNP